MSGWTPRRADTATVPMMPTSRLTANEMRVPMKVSSSTLTGMAYQRGGRGVGGMLLSYTIRGAEEVWGAAIWTAKKSQIELDKIFGISKLWILDPGLIRLKYWK